MENYISILIFLVPGFIVSKIQELLGNKKKYNKDIKTIVEILMYDILIFTIQAFILYIAGYRNLKQIVDSIGEFRLLFALIGCLSTTSIGVGVLLAFLRPKYTEKILNYVRRRINKPPVREVQVWDTILNMGPCFLEVNKNGKTLCKGQLESANFSASEDKEIMLANGHLLDERKDLFDEKSSKCYYNIDKDIVIKVYDPAKVIAESKKYNT